MANPKTPNLGLNKVDRSTPTTTTFNTKPLIDDNADLLDAQFDPALGHKHDGTAGNGPKLDPTTVLTNVPLLLDGSQTMTGQFKSNVADGTAPMSITSKTKVPNLHVDQLDGYDANATPTANTIPVRDANRNLPVDLLITNKGHQPNLLLNPSFRQGSVGWTKIGTLGFSIQRGANGEGVFLSNNTSTEATAVQTESIRIPMAANIDLTISGDMYTLGATAGSIQIQVYAFNAAGAALSGDAIVLGFGKSWTKVSKTWRTPANTASVYIACIVVPNTTFSGLVAWRNLKLETGSYTTAFSDDMLGATYAFPDSAFRATFTGATAQALAAATWTKVTYDTKTYDNKGEYDPATSRFTAAENGVYMVSACVASASVAAGTAIETKVYVNGADASRLGLYYTGTAGAHAINGSATVYLNKGDYVEIYAKSLAAITLSSGTDENFEITKIANRG